MSSKNSDLEILYRDENFIVVNKFSGLLVHASKIDRYETRFALQMLRDQINEKVFLIHRLDKATSGALAFATSPEAAKLLSLEFAERRVEKKYLALVRGTMPQSVEVDHALKEIQDRKTDLRARTEKPAQEAKSNFRCLSTCEVSEQVDRYPTSRYSLVEATPLTGRKHQIRRHLKHLSHPIIGDVNYGSGVHNQFFRERFGSNRLLLACTSLGFLNPFTKKEVLVKAPIEKDFQDVIARLGFSL